MIKRLKIKFVMINMILLICVLSMVFTGIYLLMHKSSKEQAIAMMQGIAKNDGRSIKPRLIRDNNPPPPLENLRALNSFSVKVDNLGNLFELTSEFTMDVNDETIKQAIILAFNKEKHTGIIKVEDTQLRFLKQEKPYGQIIVFLDRYNELTTLNRLILVLITIGIISIIILFIVSLYLASWAVNPISKAWEKQKQFIADASHELKTPLTVIGANADVILGSPNDTIQNQSKWIGYIKSETERMSKLVNNLLYIAKLDSDEDMGIYLPFNLSNAVMNTILPFESVIFEQGMNLELEISPDIYFAGDEERIKQIIVILTDNAVKNSKEKGKIKISLSVIKEKGRICLSVFNSGESIPPEEIEKIFERFYRVDKSRARETGGYGLGLSIAKSIALQHKGKISAKSKKGVGTTFEVMLPYK